MSRDILFIIPTFPEASETFVISNIVALQKLGYDTPIIAIRGKKDIASTSQKHIVEAFNLLEKTSAYREPKGKISRYIQALAILSDFRLWHYFMNYNKMKGKTTLSHLFRIHFFKKFREARIIHIHFAVVAPEIAILKAIGLLKGQLIVTCHGYDVFYENETQRQEFEKRYRNTFKYADVVTVNTPFLKDNVLQLGCPDSKIKVVPMSIDLDFFEPSHFPKHIPKSSPIRMVSVGRLIEFKGHVYGIDCIKILIAKGWDVRYTIIGEGRLKKDLEHRIDALGLAPYITLIGKASQQKIKNVLDESHIFLMTSITDSSGRAETQGVVSAEAQAMGLPVVGFDSGGVCHTVTKQSGILVPEKDTASMAIAVENILENSTRYAQYSEAARDWAMATYGLSKMINSYYGSMTSMSSLS